MSAQEETGDAEITVNNVGGIDETSVSFSPGVTILEGENATNRTSLLRGLKAALGSDDVSVRGDAEEASVELEHDDETYTRELRRQGDEVHTAGDPYLAESTAADLFAFLLESNEARQAVASGDDLREVIMRPIDTDEIQAEIERLVQERHEIEQELQELDSLKDELPALEERRTRLEVDIEEMRVELEAKEAELENRDTESRRHARRRPNSRRSSRSSARRARRSRPSATTSRPNARASN